MAATKLPETFLVEDRSYSREELVAYSAGMAADQSQPGWRRELFDFIRAFLIEPEGEILQKTSGTTGDPGLLHLKRSSMIRSAEMTLQFFHLRARERVLLCLPIRYIAGKMMVVRALVGGLNLVPVEPTSRPMKKASGIFRFAAMVPLQLHESVRNGDPLAEVEQLLIGGGEVHPSLRRELEILERPDIYESFAMTETYSHFALKRINGEKPDEDFRLLEGVRISRDERGCLVVDIQGVTDSAVVTGDLVEITGDGKGFRWHGRVDNVIKSGGMKIIPELLEQRIGQWLKMSCLILPEEDPRLGQRTVLMVESRDQPVRMEAWMEILRRNLPGHEFPGRIVTVREIPRNPSFKPDRKAAVALIGPDY